MALELDPTVHPRSLGELEQLLLRAMTVVQTFVQGSGDLEATLAMITAVAADALGADMAGITLWDERTRPATVVHTDRMVLEVDQAQYEHDRGPCLDAARTHTIIGVDDTRTEQRWPEFAASAAGYGVHSSLSVPVVTADHGLGTLNLYSRGPSYFDHVKREIAVSFAGQCAVARLYWCTAQEAAGLVQAMETRAVIEQAKGVLIAATGCSDEDAFGLLRSQSQMENRKLRAIAEELLRQKQRPLTDQPTASR